MINKSFLIFLLSLVNSYISLNKALNLVNDYFYWRGNASEVPRKMPSPESIVLKDTIFPTFQKRVTEAQLNSGSSWRFLRIIPVIFQKNSLRDDSLTVYLSLPGPS